MISNSDKALRKQLRQQMRSARRELNSAEQERSAILLASHFSKHPWFVNSKRIAFYISNDGELDLLPLMVRALEMKKHCYLPVLGPQCRPNLTFAPYYPGSSMLHIKFGIPEPVCLSRQLLKPAGLDLVLTPLVAFDLHGNRLGMGGGYYDRSFSFRRHRKHWLAPRLVGVAHDFQQAAHVPHQDWDIPLSGIVTPTAIIGVSSEPVSGKLT